MKPSSPFRIRRLLGYGALYVALTSASFFVANAAMESDHMARISEPVRKALTFSPVWRETGMPVRLRVARLGIDAGVENVGLTASGAMDVPKDFWRVGWYDLGPRPGEKGNSVIAGHLDTMTGAAVFAKLPSMRAGDVIEVTDDRGKLRTFVVERKISVPDDDPPMEEIFGDTEGAHLNLITCGGTWNEQEGHYENRIVVFATIKP